jgi:hypothetical protein
VGKKFGTAGQVTDDNIIRRMRFALWIPKSTNTLPEYVILLPFPREQWLSERTSMLRDAYISRLVFIQMFLQK